MKYYIVEPSYKKSFVEITAFKRTDENGNLIWLRKELGWRWGSFLFSVPETVEEAMVFLKDQGYDEVLDWAYDYGHTITDDNGDEVIDPDADIVSMIVQQFLPNASDDFVDITEDYPNAEFIDAWDGCWEYWNVSSYQTEISEEEQEAIIEEVEEAYGEGYEEAVEELGWEFVDTYFEIQCNPQITPCDEDGNKFEENED